MKRLNTALLTFFIISFCHNVQADDGMLVVWDSQMNDMVDYARTVSINAAIKKNKKSGRLGPGHAPSSGGSTPPTTPRSTPAVLRYSPSPAISQRIKKDFTKALAKANPQSAEDIERKLGQQDVLGDFARDMAPYGLRPDDVADVTTAYWITMWMIANQEPAPALHEVSAVQQQIRTSMLHSPKLVNSTEGERQEMAEGLIYETMLAFGMLNNATPDAMKLTQLAGDAQRNMLKKGVDLQSLRLTSRGFSPI